MSATRTGHGRMGTFEGVFTPSVLTILGLILFLRLGFVVGSTGLIQTLVIILVANLISILTCISLSAVATNLKVKGGGVYYIISRTLGLPFGGAIGIVLFVAQAISVGFYCVGFAEGVTALLGNDDPLLAQEIAATAAIAMLLLAWLGADWATKFQYVVMALIAGALLSFGLGVFGHWDGAILAGNIGAPNGWSGFWVAFAIFFPAVTGFTQGVNMSGDLRDPGTSIPRGTALAVGLSLIIYAVVAVLCAGTLPRAVLAGDYGALKSISVFAPLFDAGIIAATLSSALASLLGAPRILQSLAKDRIFPFLQPFALGAGASNNPRRGVLLTGAIALGVIALGNLNLIAGIVSMFFVVTYGLLNYATYFEARAKSPSFRPTLKWYDSRMSLLGWLGSLGVILAIDITAGLAAIAIVFALYQYLKRSATAARWADGRRSHHLQIVREHLLEANARLEHPRDWRPQVLAFSNDSARREQLLSFADWIEGHSGLTTVVRILEGKGRHMRRAREQAEEALAKELRTKGFDAFPLVVYGPELDATVHATIQAAGIGPLSANTVLVNWFEQTSGADTPGARQFGRNLHAAFLLGCNVLMLDCEEHEWQALLEQEPGDRVIDIWWADRRSGQFMLVLAYLLTRNDAWEGATIRVLVPAKPEAEEATRKQIETTLREVRIRAEVQVVAEAESSIEPVAANSAESSIVFMALRFQRERFVDSFGNDLAELLPRLPVVIMTMAAEELDLSADPDEGEEGTRAAANDAYDDARRRRDKAARALAKAQAEIDKAAAERDKAKADEPESEDARARLQKLQAEAAEHATAVAAATAALAAAREVAESLGVTLKEDEDETGDEEAG